MIIILNTETILLALDKIAELGEPVQRIRVADNYLFIECDKTTVNIDCKFNASTIWYEASDKSWKDLHEILKKISREHIILEIKTNFLDLIIEL